MGQFGKVAVKATCLLISKEVSDPRKACDSAVRTVLSYSTSMMRKHCPRSAYLGLCEEGLVKGAPPGNWTESVDNKRYAVDAVRYLRKCPSWIDKPTTHLWREVTRPRTIRHNDQIDVVFALLRKELIILESVPEESSN
jgi:hypothetical protein